MDDVTKNAIINDYLKKGGDALYKKLIISSVKKIAILIGESEKKTFPEVEMLNISNIFLGFYRSEGEDHYLEISKIYRKVAHKIYRVLLKKNLISKNNNFLNLVKNGSH